MNVIKGIIIFTIILIIVILLYFIIKWVLKYTGYTEYYRSLSFKTPEETNEFIIEQFININNLDKSYLDKNTTKKGAEGFANFNYFFNTTDPRTIFQTPEGDIYINKSKID